MEIQKIDPIICEIILNLRKNGASILEKKAKEAALEAKMNSFFGK